MHQPTGKTTGEQEQARARPLLGTEETLGERKRIWGLGDSVHEEWRTVGLTTKTGEDRDWWTRRRKSSVQRLA
jgi:hypothetical protein